MAYDVFFLSYQEPNAEDNWEKLKSKVPHARRVQGVKGILEAHKECARKALTSHFFVVDADSEVLDASKLAYKVDPSQASYVHLWYAANPVNGLEYGWGGLKLFPKRLLQASTSMGTDMTTGFDLVVVPEVASVTHFNSSPYDAWRSAFRETVKLSRNTDDDSLRRLNVWRTEATGNHAEWCLRGANDGYEFAQNTSDLLTINDWSWLREEFSKRYE